ncbi:hypothetical protein KEM60_02061 [Austwickia sp. TVS 96-490-7B]|uniref:hypothetical protein n=1 Tax=Austwickia sp. TVS 96-490-7B TaxID=2830843 RepID=UPI001C59A5EB|nr:hypothetical protein [Austwickia sp. TVS 96-490-7B]MBW3085850.1 hypothetical protein [Austwickia sp. TVS 96-490-7B]
MSLIVDRLSIAGPHGALLPPTSFTAPPGQVTLVAGDPGPSGTALALAIGGRMSGCTGVVALDTDARPRIRRKAVALVDVPDVTEPEPSLSLRVVIGEELALAGKSASLAEIYRFIGSHVADLQEGGATSQLHATPTTEASDIDPEEEPAARRAKEKLLRERHIAYGKAVASRRWDTVPPAARVAWLTGFAEQHRGVKVLVLTHPDRWGGNPHDWYRTAAQAAAAGNIVVVICTHASVRLLGRPLRHELGVAA